MTTSQRAFTCLRCRRHQIRIPLRRAYHASTKVQIESEAARPSIAPRPSINVRHIREHPKLYEQNCLERNYIPQATHANRISNLFARWQEYQRKARTLRERNNRLKLQLSNPTALLRDESEESRQIGQMTREEIIEEARTLKEKISLTSREEDSIIAEIDALALAIPNLTSDKTPRGDEPQLIGYINDSQEDASSKSSDYDRVWRSHVDIGAELNLFDFSGAATASGWGWYYLLNEAALLEQALVQYAIQIAMKHGWGLVNPPSMVYSHIAAACGFQPRDQRGEQQIYSIQQSPSDAGRKPELSLTATAEIPLAGMKANTKLEEADLPLKHVGVSRCFRAEAGARGIDTKGLYRVHEFTKVEMFAWTLPSDEASTQLFDAMVAVQREILESLGLRCRILEMPSADLGASATRKRDIEAFFPSRTHKAGGWGEVTSASICTDYQSRRLATRVDMRSLGGKLLFPHTVNGTALAVPRVLAALLENGWDEASMSVRIPEVLWPWMGGLKTISRKSLA